MYIAKVSSKCCKSRLKCCTVRAVSAAAPGAQSWVNPRGFPYAGRRVAGPCDGRGRGCWGRTRGVGRDADAGVAQVSELCPDVTSRPDVRALGMLDKKIVY